jgi:hypothetical protein
MSAEPIYSHVLKLMAYPCHCKHGLQWARERCPHGAGAPPSIKRVLKGATQTFCWANTNSRDHTWTSAAVWVCGNRPSVAAHCEAQSRCRPYGRVWSGDSGARKPELVPTLAAAREPHYRRDVMPMRRSPRAGCFGIFRGSRSPIPGLRLWPRQPQLGPELLDTVVKRNHRARCIFPMRIDAHFTWEWSQPFRNERLSRLPRAAGRESRSTRRPRPAATPRAVDKVARPYSNPR